MNEKQRNELDKLSQQLSVIHSSIEGIRDDEADKLDNMPENMQGGDKGQRQEEIVNTLTEAVESLSEVIDKLSEATSD